MHFKFIRHRFSASMFSVSQVVDAVHFEGRPGAKKKIAVKFPPPKKRRGDVVPKRDLPKVEEAATSSTTTASRDLARAKIIRKRKLAQQNDEDKVLAMGMEPLGSPLRNKFAKFIEKFGLALLLSVLFPSFNFLSVGLIVILDLSCYHV